MTSKVIQLSLDFCAWKFAEAFSNGRGFEGVSASNELSPTNKYFHCEIRNWTPVRNTSENLLIAFSPSLRKNFPNPAQHGRSKVDIITIGKNRLCGTIQAFLNIQLVYLCKVYFSK